MAIDDGGPAFPRVGEGFGNPLYDAPGMTLRDYFAGQALTGLIAHDIVDVDAEWLWSSGFFGSRAYELADAMMFWRDRYKEEDHR